MTSHADQDRCLPLAAGSFCTMKVYVNKKKSIKFLLKSGFKFPTHFNQRYFENCSSCPSVYFLHLMSRMPHSADFLPISLVTSCRSLLLIRMSPSPHASKITSLSYFHFLGDSHSHSQFQTSSLLMYPIVPLAVLQTCVSNCLPDNYIRAVYSHHTNSPYQTPRMSTPPPNLSDLS